MEKAGLDDFQLEIRAAFRQLWAGLVDAFGFVDEMVSILNRRLVQAWNEGADVCGIKPDELTQEEVNARTEFINGQFVYLPRLARYIIDVRELAIQDGKTPSLRNMPTQLFVRSGLWVNAYRDAKTQGQSMACADMKGKFKLGPTEEHCKSCAGFNGRVYRMSTWIENNALPQSRALACHGYRCQCVIEPTNERITPGKFPVSLLS